MKIIFTGNHNISKGVWRIIGQADLIEEKNNWKYLIMLGFV
ncbi:hypothetical protein [Enterobacter bugandensis]|nr:hypothetical protein [Enterobacter bugandensis]